MSFPSCIKIPTPKNNIPTARSNHNIDNDEAISYEELITMANEVFGHGKWSHAITSQTIDYAEYVMGKYLIGCAAFVKVQLADGTFHEALGYNYTESGVKGAALFSARTLSITQALKQALLCFAGPIADRINEKSALVLAVEEKVKRERNFETAASTSHKVQLKNGTKESVERLSPAVEIGPPKKSVVKEETSENIPKRNKSPKLTETNDSPKPVNGVPIKSEARETIKAPGDRNSVPQKDKPSALMTEEEIRLERKRKQKQKQEEYKKLMMEKMTKSTENTNPRF